MNNDELTELLAQLRELSIVVADTADHFGLGAWGDDAREVAFYCERRTKWLRQQRDTERIERDPFTREATAKPWRSEDHPPKPDQTVGEYMAEHGLEYGEIRVVNPEEPIGSGEGSE